MPVKQKKVAKKYPNDEACQPNKGGHLIFREAELPFDPEEDLLVCEQDSTDRPPRFKAITKPVPHVQFLHLLMIIRD